jgi:hypothetical protein
MATKQMFLAALALAVGCTKASTPADERDRGVAPRAKATVTLTSVAFADDCGGTPPVQAPVRTATTTAVGGVPASPAVAVPADEGVPTPGAVAARRRCEQTSMQLAVVGDAPAELHIKSVEVFDERGKAVGKLTASKPTRWDDGHAAYEPWDEHLVGGNMAVSYVLSQPAFVDIYDARDRTYTVKVVAAVGGTEQALQTTVMVVGRPPAVPT